MTDARVILWGRDIGAVSWLDEREVGVFQYLPEFVRSRIEVAPLMMPLREEPYEFPALPRDAFRGLPGLLADSLPDKFGNAVIDAWLASRGRTPSSYNPVDRLCYIGTRGMGALEFRPARSGPGGSSSPVEIERLVRLANEILDERSSIEGRFSGADDRQVIEDILRVGSSAGGARAKAILAWNEETGEFRSGQIPNDPGFTYWLMKFDGVDNNMDRDVKDPQGYGLIEYAYYLMAQDAGVAMSPCRVHYEGGRAHFMTKRFDRTDTGAKLHMQTLGAIMHFDYNARGANSYEQSMQAMRRMDMPTDDIEQQLRRAAFNVLARNQDDHVKNIAFLMNQSGEWRLSPAFDVTYSYRPDSEWVSRHLMSINGKRDDFVHDDLVALAASASIKKTRAGDIIDDVAVTVDKWPAFAASAGVPESTAKRIRKAHRRLVPSRS